MGNYSFGQVVIIELSLFAVFAVFVNAYLEKTRNELFSTVVITLIFAPIVYFYLVYILVELYFEKENPIKKEDILIVIALLLLVLLILSVIDINSLWYKVYIGILLVSVLQVYLTVKFNDKLKSRDYEL